MATLLVTVVGPTTSLLCICTNSTCSLHRLSKSCIENLPINERDGETRKSSIVFIEDRHFDHQHTIRTHNLDFDIRIDPTWSSPLLSTFFLFKSTAEPSLRLSRRPRALAALVSLALSIRCHSQHHPVPIVHGADYLLSLSACSRCTCLSRFISSCAYLHLK